MSVIGVTVSICEVATVSIEGVYRSADSVDHMVLVTVLVPVNRVDRSWRVDLHQDRTCLCVLTTVHDNVSLRIGVCKACASHSMETGKEEVQRTERRDSDR